MISNKKKISSLKYEGALNFILSIPKDFFQTSHICLQKNPDRFTKINLYVHLYRLIKELMMYTISQEYCKKVDRVVKRLKIYFEGVVALL